MPLPEALKSWRADLAAAKNYAEVAYGPAKSGITLGGRPIPPNQMITNAPMPYEGDNPALAKTLKWVFYELRKVYSADDTAPVVYLIREALEAKDVTAALHTLAAHCCHNDLVPSGSNALKTVRTPIPQLQHVLDQLARLKTTWEAVI